MSVDSRLERVVVRNFRSIGYCDVRLARLNYLVGQNGSGKSNFLDVMHFVRDALVGSLENALNERGGISEVRRRSSGHPHHFGIRLEMSLSNGHRAVYAFEIGAKKGGSHTVQSEQCVIDGIGRGEFYVLKNGALTSHSDFPFPAVTADRLALVALSGMQAFRPVFDHLTSMGFYNLNPKLIRELQLPQDGKLLKPAGENAASVIGHLERHAPESMANVHEYLKKIMPALQSVSRERLGHMETLEFRQSVVGAEHPWRFLAQNMSDGTLRALGVLTALFQRNVDFAPTLIGIEEPETALHPAASAALREALRVASESVQVLVTSHSPDLLDDPTLEEDALLAVTARDGETRVATLDTASRDAMKRHLFTAGELLRLGQLVPDPDVLEAQSARQADLFADATD